MAARSDFERGRGRAPVRGCPTLLVALLAALLVLLLPRGGCAGAYPPVVLVPGAGGTYLQARWNKTSVPAPWCTRIQREWTDVWLALDSFFVPGGITCWSQNFRLVNWANGTSTNMPGVEVRVGYTGRDKSFGALEPVLCIDPSLCRETGYFAELARALQERAGLAPGETLLAAPYDHRYATDADAGPNADWEVNLTALVERASQSRGGAAQRVVLVSHSLGGLAVLHWLQNRTQAWKDAYLGSWVAISAPFGGSAKVFRMLASGDSDLVPGVPSLSVRDEQRTAEAEHWLLPRPEAYGTKTVLTGPDGTNYTTSYADKRRLFDALGLGNGFVAVHERVSRLLDLETPPGVRLLALAGADLKTEQSYDYRGSSKGWDAQPAMTYNVGDSVVSSASLRLCKQWPNVTYIEYAGVDHTALLQDEFVFRKILSELAHVATHTGCHSARLDGAASAEC